MEDEMNRAIQHAYYLYAQNPSDNKVLCSLAQKLGLDPGRFEIELEQNETQLALKDEVRFARAIGGNSFPSWILEKDGDYTSLPIDYKSPQSIISKALEAFEE